MSGGGGGGAFFTLPPAEYGGGAATVREGLDPTPASAAFREAKEDWRSRPALEPMEGRDDVELCRVGVTPAIWRNLAGVSAEEWRVLGEEYTGRVKSPLPYYL